MPSEHECGQTPMLKYRHLLSKQYSHIVPLPCALHVANLLTKDICRLEGLTDIVKGNCKIVNFFMKSHNGFMHPKNGQRRTRTTCTVFSLSVRLIAIPCARCECQLQAFLEYAASVQGTLDKYPRIPSPVIQFLTVEHFMMNDYMLELVTPVADLIVYLEKAETNLADIAVQFLTLQVHFDNMEAKCYICNKFIDVAVGIVSKQYKQHFLHPVYVIAMYLSPKYCDLAISKNFSHDYLKPEIVKLAMNWKFKKDKCIQLAQDIHKYNSFIFTKDHKTMSPMYFWKTTQQFTKPMRKLASFVLQLKGHGAPVETLLSSLSYSKPKIKNKMMTDNLKIIGLIHKSLKDIIPTQCKNDRKRDKTVGVKTTATVEETELSDNCNNNVAIVPELVDHPNNVENIGFEAEFEHLMIPDIEDADADTMLGQHQEVP